MLEPHIGIEAETQYRIQRQLSRRPGPRSPAPAAGTRWPPGSAGWPTCWTTEPARTHGSARKNARVGGVRNASRPRGASSP